MVHPGIGTNWYDDRYDREQFIYRYVLKRLFQSVFVLVAVIVIVFFVGRMIGDPAVLMLGPEQPAAKVAELRTTLGLNDPISVQFGRFLRGAIRGDFGNSFWQGVPAMGLVLGRLPATLFLAAVAFSIAIPTAIVVGSLAAWKPGSTIDRISSSLSLAGASIVDFWVGLMLILFVAVGLGWLPTSGYRGVGLESLPYVILPAITLSIGPMGRVAQVTRSAMVDELSKPYVKMARAKGVRERVVVGRHALKNGLVPTITLSGDQLTSMVNGVIIIEVIFAWPGIGQLLVQAILRRDLPTLEAIVFVVTIMVVIINLLVDLLYARLNPRIRYGSES